jgi:hypothetical protein
MSGIQIDAFCPVGIGGTKGIDTKHLKLFIGGLSPSQTSKDLHDIFAQYGTIREAVVIPDRFRVRSRCYGFVTFQCPTSTTKVFESTPIFTQQGRKVTVTLASNNTKPRRASFNVKHGVSGHKALPTVREEETSTKAFQQRTAQTTTARNTKSGVGVYSDPSLFRTANIQQIEPAKLYIDETQKSPRQYWPNQDIQNDYKKLTKVVLNDENYNGSNKAWTVCSSPSESAKGSCFGSENGLQSVTILKQRVFRTKCSKQSSFASSASSETDDDETNLSICSRNELNPEYDLKLDQFAQTLADDVTLDEVPEKVYTMQSSVPSNQTWSQYQPQFANNANASQMSYGYHNYDFAAIAPTPPVQSVAHPMSIQNAHSVNNVNHYFAAYTPTTSSQQQNNQCVYGQMNPCFYASMPVYNYSVHSTMNRSQ